MKSFPIAPLVLSVLIMLLLLACSADVPPAPPVPSAAQGTVAAGDTVSVWYTGKLDDDSVFDSNIEEVAKAAGTFNPARPYEPLSFAVGAGQMIPGFDKAVVGMKTGEKKTVTIPPEEAYGQVQPELTRTLPVEQDLDRVVVIERFRNVPALQFKSLFGSEPVMGKAYPNAQVEWNYIVRDTDVVINDVALVKVEADIRQGQRIHLPNTQWNSTVIGMNETVISMRQDPVDGSALQTPFGPAVVTVTENKLNVKINPVEGTVIPGPQGQVKIVAVSGGEMTLDLNHPLAGKSLTFDIEIIEIKKPKAAGQ